MWSLVELNNLKLNRTEIITLRWVFKIKDEPEGKRYKARMYQMDVKTAFLNGNLENYVYMAIPKENSKF